ncbi:hypothetical protein [Pantanalinema sp. GBBB05]|uniref:hypothetical protein n=1 Tax=Pantanalinema sp. GBBB05 TaxID=2604139 RepID=UPI001DAECDC5|nr:hypothetical protein [Pantanalinema sp. GBBB05]
MQPMRQGDVILMPIPANRATGQLIPHLTLAEGEVTGHRHRISEGSAELREQDGVMYLMVDSDTATLTHEEHKSIQIPQGAWMVRIQRQYEPGEWGYVED